MDPNESSISHNAAFKLGLRELLYRTRAGAAWIFSDDAIEVLRTLWSEAAAVVEESDRREPEGLEVLGIHKDAGYLVRIIRCPVPHNIAENHFVALAYRPEHRHILPWRRRPPEVRYLALESSFDENGPTTVLGEWTDTGHVNYGSGPEPTADEFVAAAKRILAGGVAAEAVYVSLNRVS